MVIGGFIALLVIAVIGLLGFVWILRSTPDGSVTLVRLPSGAKRQAREAVLVEFPTAKRRAGSLNKGATDRHHAVHVTL
jgi:hypothetical protein